MLHVLTAVPLHYMEELLENERFKLVLREKNASIPPMWRATRRKSYFYIVGGQMQQICHRNKALNCRNLDILFIIYTWILSLPQSLVQGRILNEPFSAEPSLSAMWYTAPPTGLLVPLNCFWLGNVVVQGVKLFSWLHLWTRNHDSLEGRRSNFYTILYMQKVQGEHTLHQPFQEISLLRTILELFFT